MSETIETIEDKPFEITEEDFLKRVTYGWINEGTHVTVTLFYGNETTTATLQFERPVPKHIEVPLEQVKENTKPVAKQWYVQLKQNNKLLIN